MNSIKVYLHSLTEKPFMKMYNTVCYIWPILACQTCRYSSNTQHAMSLIIKQVFDMIHISVTKVTAGFSHEYEISL